MIPYGADYYPEHWPRERWVTDARMMAECGFNVVRVGEFAWSVCEPEPGRYEFGWLDEAMEILDRHGIKIIMGTPTSGVPPWLSAKYPESLLVDSTGRRAGPGGRYFTCFTHVPFLEACQNLVSAQVAHYKGDKRIIGWHIHNELGGSKCFCDRCREDFQGWLKQKYGDISELNRRMGTVFWSQVFNDFGEVPGENTVHGESSPGLSLAWRRWFLDLMFRFAKTQFGIIRAGDPGKWVSTNLRSRGVSKWLTSGIDPHDKRLFELLDRAGYNNYPRSWDADDLGISYKLDAVRPPGARLNPIDFEQRGGQAGYNLVSRLTRPGELRLLALQPIAHGADGLLYFRWRVARFGHENLWGGILRHDGEFHPLVKPEVERVGKELAALGDVLEGSRVESEVAILRSQDCAWALARQPQQERLNYDAHVLEYYRAGVRFGVNLDVVEPAGDFGRYKVLIMPVHYLMTEDLAERLTRFVGGGGVLLSTFRSAVADDDVVMPASEGPAFLHGVFGVMVSAYDVQEVERYGSKPDASPGRIRFARGFAGGTAKAHTWYDLLKLKGARPLAFYDSDFYKGTPAITEMKYGRGTAIYVGCASENKTYDALFRRCCSLAGVKPLAKVPDGVEVRERVKDGTRLRFFLNYSPARKSVRPGPGWTDAVSGKRVPAVLSLPKFDVRVLRKQS